MTLPQGLLDALATERTAKALEPDRVESLERLVALAQGQGTGARVAAVVLLSVHDGSRYPLDVSELGLLDPEAFEDAMNVIRLRAQNGREPHEFVGEEVMRRILEQWSP